MVYTHEQVEKALGRPANDWCDALYARRPKWVTGYVSHRDARFLFRSILASGVETVLEIGTASGVSTAIMCHALQVGSEAGLIGNGFSVASYDLSSSFYADPTKRVGDAARELLPDGVLSRIKFRNPATAIHASAEFGPNQIPFAFIDANHEHPWPTLDLLALLDCLKPGAEVALHDINLPSLVPESQQWGAKWLFDEVEAEKRVPEDDAPPNVGSIRVPDDKEAFRRQLLRILHGHPWQATVPAVHLAQVGVNKAVNV